MYFHNMVLITMTKSEVDDALGKQLWNRFYCLTVFNMLVSVEAHTWLDLANQDYSSQKSRANKLI